MSSLVYLNGSWKSVEGSLLEFGESLAP
jgi:hypothetical protein